jgi:RHS repeat-associated protein
MNTPRRKTMLKLSILVLLVLSNAMRLRAQTPNISSLSPTSGLVGTSVTVTGTNFGSTQGTSTVKFNGTSATVTSWSSGSIQVTVPSAATTGNVVVNVGGTNSNGVAFTVTLLPTGWSDGDIGSVGIAGSATYSNGTFTINASGQSIWGTADQMNLAYQQLSGDGTIVARVVSMTGTSAAQAGVMIRETLNGNSTNVYTELSSSQVYFSNRASSGGSTTRSSGPSATLPYWVKAARSGSTFSGYASSDGVNWVQVSSSQTITMATNIYIGLAVSSNNNAFLETVTFDSVSVSSAASPAPIITSLSATTGTVGSQVVISGSNFGAAQGSSAVLLNDSPMTVDYWSGTAITITIPSGATSGPMVVSVAPSMNDSNPVEFTVTTQPLPLLWLDQDVGQVGTVGTATYANGTITINATGQSIGGTADQMHFVYQPLSGDGTIVARVVSLTGTSAAQAGVMVRETLDTSSTNAYTQSYQARVYFSDRASSGGSTTWSSFLSAALPYWVKAVRSGSTFSGYASSDGVNWVQVGTSQTITMATNVYIGLAVSSDNNASSATAKLDNVSVSSTASPAPVITGLSATTGSIGAQVVISGSNFGATQGSSVVLLNASPVTINSWSGTAITITIPTGATSGPLVVSVSPSMNNSNPVQFTVTTEPLPSLWLDQDVGAVGLAGSATYANGTFTVNGAGLSASGTSDGVHFVYQPLSGDGTIVARVAYIPSSMHPLAGVMIRETLNANAADAFVYFAPNTAVMYDRPSTGASSTYQSASFAAAAYPYWTKLVRSGSTFTGYISSDSVNWTQIGTGQTVTMAQTVYIGLAVSSQSTTTLNTVRFDSVSVNSAASPAPVIASLSATTGAIGSQVTIAGSNFGATQGSSTVLLSDIPMTVNSWSNTSITVTISSGAVTGYLAVCVAPSMNCSNPKVFTVTSQPLPTGWLDGDIGTVGLTGSATYSNGTFTVKAAGQGISGAADGMHFVYQSLSGDGAIVARVTNAGSGASLVGAMIRETLNAGATDAFVDFSPNTASFSDRATTGGNTTSQFTSYAAPYYPYWVEVARTGNTFSTYISQDGSTWTPVGTGQTFNMAQTVYVGLGASSQSTSTLITAAFDNVAITSGTMPIISGITPTSGGIGTSVTISGSNFGSSQGASTINFNGVAATSITSWANNQIVAVFPSNATSGPVTVVANSIRSNGNFPFTLYHPVITNLSPSTGQVGATVTITGSGFTVGEGTGSGVSFNGVAAQIPVWGWSDTSITVYVSTGTTSGPVTVTKAGVTSNSLPFTVENLSVTSISPSIGPAGSVVRVFGTGFGTTQANSTVDFYGLVASVQSWSDTEIDAIVPAGTISGTVDVTVGGILWYGPNFTVTKQVQLTDSKNNQSTYTSAMVGGNWMPSVGQGSGCSTCTQRGNISYTSDASGNVLSRTDENGNTTTYTYDSNGNVLTATVPISSGHTATTTYTYNSFGEVLTATDPLNNVTTNTYDAKGNLLSVTTPAPGNGASASVTQFAYNSLGELTKITDPLNNQTTIAYFPTGLIQTITDAQSNVTTYAYDSQGNRTLVTDANNKQTTFTYDAMNRLTKITYPDSTTTQFGYDIRGRRTSATDQNSKQTTYAYDDADRFTSVTDAANNVTTYGYDTESNLTSIKDANQNSTTFDYDAFGRVTETHFPSGQIEQYGYDNVGNLTSKTDRKNQQITYTYDQLNRLGKKTYPDTTTVNYTYDNDSRLTQVSDPTGAYQFTLDNMGRLTGTTTSYAFLAGRNFTTGYGYDAASNRTSFTDPESGSTAYVYDTLNRLQTLTPPVAISGGSFGFGYDALSRRTSLTRPNTVNTSYNYDNLSRLLSVTHAKGGVTLDGATYTLDNAGNRNSKADLYAGVTTNYGYDNIYELLSATQGASTTESYTYDPVGNRLSNLSGSGWSNNTSNELTSRPGVTYTYDNNGNTLTRTDSTGTTNYSWDFENRMTSVTLPGSGGTVSFAYDPFGRRIKKVSTAGTSIFAYDGDNLVEETNASGGVVARYSQGLNIDEPLAMLRSSTTSYYQADGLGSVTALTNAAGTASQNYTYDSFGNIIATTGSLVNSFRYTGREWDQETSLYYYRARYYDPTIGNFISEDPIRFGAGVNFYSYAFGDPVKYIDPDGKDVTITISNRTYSPSGISVSGTITVTSDQTSITFTGSTLENAHAGEQGDKPPVPGGTYDGFIRTNHDPNRIQLKNVPGYSDIQIHNGSHPSDFHGCFGAGTSPKPDFLGGTRNAMKQISKIIQADGTGRITIIVNPIQNGKSQHPSCSPKPTAACGQTP